MRSRPLQPLVWVLALVLGTAAEGRAQIAPLTYELRAGAALPVGEMGEAGRSWAGETGAGASFGMSFAYTIRWFLAPYVGFSQHRYTCPAVGCGKKTELAGTGFDVGARWILGSGRVIPLLRTGLLAYRMEGTAPVDGGGFQRVTSHRTLGFEGGASISVRLSRRLVITPGVRYLEMGPRFRGPGELPVRSVVADVGLLLGF